MASRNALKDFAKETALYKKKYKAFFNDFCERNYQALIGAIAKRTPVDFGVLREGWSKHSTIEYTDNKVIYHICNPVCDEFFPVPNFACNRPGFCPVSTDEDVCQAAVGKNRHASVPGGGNHPCFYCIRNFCGDRDFFCGAAPVRAD